MKVVFNSIRERANNTSERSQFNIRTYHKYELSGLQTRPSAKSDEDNLEHFFQ